MTDPPRLETVACLGPSTTASRGTYKWIDELEKRPRNGQTFHERLMRAGTTKPFTRFSFASLYRDYLWREMVLRQSFDEISRRNGWQFHIDGIHLNTNGGRILTEVVQEFLAS
ncbi:hypothetical protein [Mycobacterium sp. 1081908.1]|uniref:hypothetical protein n=1 Tax=Mycobacterium sp. 1081908.1 TaxID=1834066 RepID=UPI000AC1B052|nr:hypothetical protein [Mycobacterium sp. 1081908.1]